MNKHRHPCHYSIVRFCPYPETDEFVNVGVVLTCPSLGYLDFKRARKRLARVSDFFPELNPKIFSDGLQSLNDTLLRHRQPNPSDQLLADFDIRRRRDDFFSLTRPRETILFFSEPRVILSEAPQATLDELFASYVDRRFAHVAVYQEVQMCRRLEDLLRDHNLLGNFEKDKPVGDDRYRVNFPFVRFDGQGQRAQRAIKALHLDKEDSTDIFRHADSWRSTVRRLRDFRTAPINLLFVMHPPRIDKLAHREAFDRVIVDFKSEKIPTTLDDQTDSVLAFASQ